MKKFLSCLGIVIFLTIIKGYAGPWTQSVSIADVNVSTTVPGLPVLLKATIGSTTSQVFLQVGGDGILYVNDQQLRIDMATLSGYYTNGANGLISSGTASENANRYGMRVYLRDENGRFIKLNSDRELVVVTSSNSVSPISGGIYISTIAPVNITNTNLPVYISTIASVNIINSNLPVYASTCIPTLDYDFQILNSTHTAGKTSTNTTLSLTGTFASYSFICSCAGNSSTESTVTGSNINGTIYFIDGMSKNESFKRAVVNPTFQLTLGAGTTIYYTISGGQ